MTKAFALDAAACWDLICGNSEAAASASDVAGLDDAFLTR
jgi:hypothetical protein